MKKIKNAVFIVAFVLGLVGMSGCANTEKHQNNRKIMKQYAEEKYGKEFEELSYLFAQDDYSTDRLALSDGKDFIFNVYHRPKDENFESLYDDYIEEAVNQKFCDYFAEKGVFLFEGATYNLMVSLGNTEPLSLDEVRGKTAAELREEYGVNYINLLCVVEADRGFIWDHAKQFYAIYNYLEEMSLNGVQMHIVVGKTSDKALMRCVKNPNLFYEDDWQTYKSVKEYLSITERGISDLNEFMSHTKKVRFWNPMYLEHWK